VDQEASAALESLSPLFWKIEKRNTTCKRWYY
jgi:hypothetical protein